MSPAPARHLRRACLLLALAAASVAAPGSGASLHAQGTPAPADTLEEGVFEVLLPPLAATPPLVTLMDPAGEPLVPVVPILEYVGVPLALSPGGDTLTLEWPPGEWRTRLVAGTGTVSARGSSYIIPSGERAVRAGQLYLSTAALGRVLGARIRVDREALRIVIEERADFPALRQHLNATRRAAERRAPGPGRDGEEALDSVRYAARSGGVAASWGVSVLGGSQGRLDARLGVGAALAGGSLEAAVNTALTSGGGSAVGGQFLRYTRAFPQGRRIRQLRAGDMNGGLLGNPFFGLSVSNEPYYAPRFFSEALIRPVIPAGWEYEVYQGNYLVGVSTRGSNEPVTAAIGYGTTPVRVRLIGPAGQERTEQLVFLVPATRVPAGQWRYQAGGGRCRHDVCGNLAYLDVRRGLTDWLTVGAGVDYETGVDSTARLGPHALLSASPRPGLLVELRAQPGTFYNASLQRAASGFGQWSLSGGWNGSGVGAPDIPYFGEASVSLPVPAGRNPIPLHLSTRVRAGEDGQLRSWQVSGATSVRRVLTSVTYESGFQPHNVLSAQTSVFVPQRVLGVVRDLAFLSEAGVAGSTLEYAGVGATFRGVGDASITASVRTSRTSPYPALALGVVTRTRGAYVRASANAGAPGAAWFASANGGLAYGRDAGLIARPYEMIGRGGTTGRVFVDSNGNGRYDAGEVPVDSVPVALGGERALSDARGLYRLWGVAPYAVLEVAVDTLNLVRSDLSPASGEHLVRPAPNVYTRVDLPLRTTREVIGRVRWRGAGQAPGGVTIEIHPAGGGAPRRVLTFSDGEFYLSRVAAGEYEVRVATTSLQALGAATPVVLRFVVPSAGDASTVDAGTILLTRGTAGGPAPPRSGGNGRG